MNRERTKELLPVMWAYADGKDVQVYKEPGLVRSWYRAKKQKICPFITVKD